MLAVRPVTFGGLLLEVRLASFGGQLLAVRWSLPGRNASRQMIDGFDGPMAGGTAGGGENAVSGVRSFAR